MDNRTIEQERFREAQQLAELGLGKCHGPCKRTLSLIEMISVAFRNTIASTVCPQCFDHVDLHISMKAEGLNLELIKRSPIILLTK